MPKTSKASRRIHNKRKVGFSWKKLVKSNKFKKSIRKTVTTFVLFFASLFVLGGIIIYRNITKSFANADSSSSYDINEEEIVTLALISVDSLEKEPVKANSINFLVFDKSKKKVLTYEIDPKLQTDVVGKYGNEEYGNLISIGMMSDEKLSSGVNTLVNNLKRDFAFSVDKYLVIDDTLTEPVLDLFINGSGNELLNVSVIKELLSSYSNLYPSEFYNLFTFVRSLRSDRFVINKSFDVLANAQLVDDTLRDITFDSDISEEKTSVGILNGTDIPGVATFSSRVIKNMGGYVISAENASQKYDNSMIVTTSMDFAVLQEIQRYFGIDNIVLKDRSGINEGITDRVDVTIILGFDISDTL